MCAHNMSRYIFLGEWAGDWLPPFLNAAGTTRAASWRMVLDRDIDRFELDLECKVYRPRLRIFMRDGSQEPLENDWYVPN